MLSSRSCIYTPSVESGGQNAEFYQRVRKIGIQWPRRPEKKWLLANKYAVGPLLEFLKDTDVGSAGKRQGRRRPIKRSLASSYSLVSGGQVCPKAEYTAEGSNRRGKAMREKKGVGRLKDRKGRR